MQKIPKQEYTAEFKEQAVKRAQEAGVAGTARELGLVEQTEVPSAFRLPEARAHAAFVG